jgi:hypothetical protein
MDRTTSMKSEQAWMAADDDDYDDDSVHMWFDTRQMLQTAVRVIETRKIGQFVAHLVTAPTSHTKAKNFVARDSCNKRITDTNITTSHN